MEIIRKNAFETNSSSSHSLIIDESVKIYSTIPLDTDGNIALTGGQFGWEWEKYTDSITKANYLAIYAECNPNPSYRLALRNVIQSHTGAKSVVFAFSTDWEEENYSYIDHRSLDGANHIFESEQKIKDFIFGGGVLYTGNDNNGPPPGFYD